MKYWQSQHINKSKNILRKSLQSADKSFFNSDHIVDVNNMLNSGTETISHFFTYCKNNVDTFINISDLIGISPLSLRRRVQGHPKGWPLLFWGGC